MHILLEILLHPDALQRNTIIAVRITLIDRPRARSHIVRRRQPVRPVREAIPIPVIVGGGRDAVSPTAHLVPTALFRRWQVPFGCRRRCGAAVGRGGCFLGGVEGREDAAEAGPEGCVEHGL